MSHTINVRCIAPHPVPNFTDGRIYVATHHCNRLYELKDDSGRVRYFIPDEPCPHLPPRLRAFWSHSLGRFETVKGDACAPAHSPV